MNQTLSLEVDLIGPSLWMPFRDQALRELDPAQRRYAQALLELAHSRHIGIAVELVAAIVPHLLAPHSRFQPDNPWYNTFARLRRELSDRNQGATRDFGLVLQANPSWVVLRLILPLIQRIMRQQRRCFLFCEEDVFSPHGANTYRDYASAQSAALAALPEREDAQLEHFWEERAISLATLTSRLASPAAESLPDSQPLAAGMLLRLAPSPQPPRRPARNLRLLPSRNRRLRRSREKEGGFDGIHLTRRPEDLDGILLSEFTHPDFLLTDRLLNTGYFALERVPRRELLRDVCVVALVPPHLADLATTNFAKACFFDFLARLTQRLRQARLTNSAFQLIEGDSHNRLGRACFPLERIPELEAVADGLAGAAWRRELTIAFRALPNLLEPDESLGQLAPRPRLSQVTEDALDWAARAWRHTLKGGRGEPNAPSSFAFLHLLLFLPADAKAPLSQSSLQRHLGIGGVSGRRISALRVPRTFEQREQWALVLGEQGERPPRNEHLESEQSVATALVEAWLDAFTKEIWRD